MLCPQQRDGDLEDDCAQHDLVEEEDGEESEEEFTDLWDPEKPEQCDQQHLSSALAHLRNRFLDRLAEVLARLKVPPQAAKEVTSAYLRESGGHDGLGHVHVVLAKDEGLTVVDKQYLIALSDILMQRARCGESNRPQNFSRKIIELAYDLPETTCNEARQILFSKTVEYAFPRVKYYMEILRKEFSHPVTTEIKAGNGYHSLFKSDVAGQYKIAARKI